MRLYVNDLSFRNDVQINEPDTLVKSFMDVCDRIKKYSFDKILMPDEYTSREIVSGYTIGNFLASKPKNSILYQKLKGIMANQLVKIEMDDFDNEIQYVKWNNEESEFLKGSLNTDTPTVSFKTEPEFATHQIQITNEYLDADENTITENPSLNNISDISHFTQLHGFLSQKQIEIAELQSKWDAIKYPIRFIERTNQHLSDNNFDVEFARGNENYKVGLANKVGTYIAKLNGWEYKSRLSTRNNRRVFKALNQLVYLSIDTQHGTFEVHDRNGIHCYEINFKGDPIEGTQHNHDIEI